VIAWAPFLTELQRLANGFGKLKDITQERALALFEEFGKVPESVWVESVSEMLKGDRYPSVLAMRKCVQVVDERQRNAEKSKRYFDALRFNRGLGAESHLSAAQKGSLELNASVFGTAARMRLRGESEEDVVTFLTMMDGAYPGEHFAERLEESDAQLGFRTAARAAEEF